MLYVNLAKLSNDKKCQSIEHKIKGSTIHSSHASWLLNSEVGGKLRDFELDVERMILKVINDWFHMFNKTCGDQPTVRVMRKSVQLKLFQVSHKKPIPQ